VLAGVAVPASAALVEPEPLRLAAGCALGWCLLALAWIDARELRLPDALTLPLLLGGLVEAALLEPSRALDRSIGAIAGYAFFRAVAAGYAWLRGRAGLGAGDSKLLAAAGAWLGWQALAWLVLLAAMAALALILIDGYCRGRINASRRVPFGPFLAFATWLMWLLIP